MTGVAEREFLPPCTEGPAQEATAEENVLLALDAVQVGLSEIANIMQEERPRAWCPAESRKASTMPRRRTGE
jgi:hypothetical protein